MLAFANLLLAALLVGALFGVWLIFKPAGLDAGAYTALHQHGVHALNVIMPVLGAITALLTIVAAALARHDPTRLALLAGAAAGFVIAGLVTRFLNQPINAVMMASSVAAPPPDWMALRDAWWRWHNVRVVTGIAGLCLLIVASLRPASVG